MILEGFRARLCSLSSFAVYLPYYLLKKKKNQKGTNKKKERKGRETVLINGQMSKKICFKDGVVISVLNRDFGIGQLWLHDVFLPRLYTSCMLSPPHFTPIRTKPLFVP